MTPQLNKVWLEKPGVVIAEVVVNDKTMRLSLQTLSSRSEFGAFLIRTEEMDQVFPQYPMLRHQILQEANRILLEAEQRAAAA